MKFSAKEEKEMLELAKAVRAHMAESLYIHGHLSEKDFEDPKVLSRKIRDYLDELKKKGEEISLVIDYQPSILEEAERYTLKEDFELAYVFFATYFEHLINGIIQVKCSKEGISAMSYKELVRRASLEDKFTWVLEILKLPKFDKSHQKTIKSVSDKRNNFIHYKYQPQSNDPRHDENEWKKIQAGIKAAIRYSKSYQTRFLYGGKARKLRLKKIK